MQYNDMDDEAQAAVDLEACRVAKRLGYTSFAEGPLFNDGFRAGVGFNPEPDTADLCDQMGALIDRLELLGQARASVDRCHPTRERLLAALDWAVSEEGRTTAGELGTVVYCNELKRRAGLAQ